MWFFLVYLRYLIRYLQHYVTYKSIFRFQSATLCLLGLKDQNQTVTELVQGTLRVIHPLNNSRQAETDTEEV